MNTVTNFIRQHIQGAPRFDDLREVREMQWFPSFIRLMRNRMTMGFFRYGPMDPHDSRNYKGDLVGAIKQRTFLYETTGNLEHLVDIANLCGIEYRLGNHPKRHFESIDDGVHVT